MDGVLEEITRLENSTAKRIYFEQLVIGGQLDSETLCQIVRRVAQEISRDEDLQQLLTTLAGQWPEDGDLTEELLQVIGRIKSGLVRDQLLRAITAHRHLDRPVEVRQIDLQEALDRGISQYQAGHYQKAAQSLEDICELESNTPQIYYWLGLSYYRLGRHREAQSQLQRAIRLDPKSAETYHALGLVYNAMKHRSMDAVQAFRKAIKLDPTYAEAYYNRGQANLKLSKNNPAGAFYVKRAREAFRHAIEIKPDYQEAYLALGQTYKKDDTDSIGPLAFYRELLTSNVLPVQVTYRLRQVIHQLEYQR